MRLISFASWLLLIPVVTYADSLGQRLSSVIEPQIRSGKSVGVVVGVLDPGGPRFYSFGETRRGSASRPAEDTLFEIGSITKTFTALLLGDAVVRHEVGFADQVGRFVPELQGQYAGSITLEQLATHTSGLPMLPCNADAAGASYADYDEQNLLAGLTDRALAQPDCELGPHPSHKISYSNWGTALLGYVLSRARGIAYPELISERIAGPLHMSDTVIFPSGAQRPRLAKGYDEKGGETPFLYRKIMFGNGALLSSARDFFAYLAAQLDPGSSALDGAVSLSHAPRASDGSSTIGLGWFIWNPEPGEPWPRRFSHEGATDGFTSAFYFDTAEKRGYFYLSNSALRPSCIHAAIQDRACDLIQATRF
jgi:CubicO group peptidase (beta-lactamase class C family)